MNPTLKTDKYGNIISNTSGQNYSFTPTGDIDYSKSGSNFVAPQPPTVNTNTNTGTPALGSVQYDISKGLPLGTNVFAWTIDNPPCAPSISTVAIIVNDLPTTSIAGINQTVCFNVPTATMTANAPTIGTGAWSLVSGTGIISNSLSPTSPISGLAIGTNVFACQSP